MIILIWFVGAIGFAALLGILVASYYLFRVRVELMRLGLWSPIWGFNAAMLQSARRRA